MQIYALTQLGKAIARSTRNPSTPEWKVIHHLDLVGNAEMSRIATYCGLSTGEASAVLTRLRHRRIVAEQTGTEV